MTFNEVVGQVNVLGPTGGYDVGSSSTAYTIQLNAVVLVSTQSGYQELWAQDVAQVNGNEVAFADNIWNFTAPGASVQASSVSGKGSVITYNGRGLYAHSTQPVQLPSAFSLMTNVKQTSSDQIAISFGYALSNQPIQWYYNVTVTFGSPVNGAYFLVSGNQMTGDYHAFDAELVLGVVRLTITSHRLTWASPCTICLEGTSFTQRRSSCSAQTQLREPRTSIQLPEGTCRLLHPLRLAR